MDEKKYIYCYKMTHDTGFAPNPYHGVLTLATCKPVIRKCAKEGYWISGWASNIVQGKDQEFNDKAQKLIYLAKVSKVLSFEEYWNNYPQKRQPNKSVERGKECFKSCGNSITIKNNDISFCGDNIYEPDDNESFGFKQHENPHHGEGNKAHDLNGKNVLVCEEFYYFGVENAIDIINKGFVLPRWKKFSLEDKEALAVINNVTENYSKGLYPKKK